MKKRITAAGMAVLCATALCLSGCGEKQNTQEAKGFQPTLDTEKQVTLSTAGFFGNFEALDQVIADFNEYYPNVNFSYEQVGIDTFESYIEANPKTDIVMTSEEIFEKLGDKATSICYDLGNAEIDLSAIDSKMLSREYHDGKLCAIPMGQNTYGLVVNVSLLEKEGLKVPTTYQEFIDVLTSLKEKGYTPIQGPNSKVYAELTQDMAYDILLNDKDLYADLTAGKDSAVEKLQPVYDRLDEILKKGFTDSAVNEKYPDDNYDQAILNFFEGDVPFWVCNTEKVSGMKKRESKSDAFQQEPFTYTYMYAPLGDNGVYAYKEPWFGFSVNKNSEHTDYALEFLRFLATKDEINTMANVKGVPSAAVESSDNEIYKNISKPEKVEIEGINEGKITSAIIENWYTSVNGYVSGTYATSQDALKAFVKMCKQ